MPVYKSKRGGGGRSMSQMKMVKHGGRVSKKVAVTKKKVARRTKRARGGSRRRASVYYGVSSDYLDLYQRKSRKLSSRGSIDYTAQYGTTTSWVPGNQAVIVVASHYTKAQYTTSAGITGVTVGSSDLKFLDLDPGAKMGGNQGGEFSNATTQDTAIHSKSCSTKLMIVNAHDAPVEMDLYWIVPRKATSSELTSAWDNMMTAGQPYNYAANQSSVASTPLYNGTIFSTAAVAGYSSYELYGETPFRFPAFRAMYKCVKKKTIVLTGGASEVINYRIFANKTVTGRYLNDLGGSTDIPWHTCHVLCLARGGPEFAVKSSDGSAAIATTGGGRLGFVVDTDYKFKAIDVSRKFTVRRIAPVLANVTTGAKMQVMGEDQAAEDTNNIGG
nr:putative capsid protein [Cressdnaviricota sp.]